MKKHLLITLIFTLLCGIMNGQHLIRVNNNAGTDADYTTLQAAQDAASSGDTIYMEGSATAYAGADISKKLTIIGPGYFLSENDSTQANKLDVQFSGMVKFNAGSDGSTISGCILGTYTYIYVSQITISRCKIYYLYIAGNCDNILIIQNYLSTIQNYSSGKLTNSIISNNIITSQLSSNSLGGPLQITNNVFSYSGVNSIDCYNASITNNIICTTNNGIIEHTGNTINNNILAGSGTNADGNQYNVPMANVFVDYSGNGGYSTDGKWQLKNGSPAIGAGIGGVDCGAFGGVSPYVLSGIPVLPHIYEASIPGTAYSGSGLSGTIKVKSGK